MGHIYFLTNASMQGIVKIGFTTKSPEERAKDLSSPTGVPTPFEVAESFPVTDPKQCEKEIHERLDEYRLGKEFFSLTPSLAVEIASDILKTYRREVTMQKSAQKKTRQHIPNEKTLAVRARNYLLNKPALELFLDESYELNPIRMINFYRALKESDERNLYSNLPKIRVSDHDISDEEQIALNYFIEKNMKPHRTVFFSVLLAEYLIYLRERNVNSHKEVTFKIIKDFSPRLDQVKEKYPNLGYSMNMICDYYDSIQRQQVIDYNPAHVFGN